MRRKSRLSLVDVEARISLMPASLQPIKASVLALANFGAWIEEGANDSLLAGHRPDIGSEAYDIVLFEPLPAGTLEEYQQLHDFTFPEGYFELLRYVNGGNLFEVKLYGVPFSMAMNPPMLDRSQRSPLDIASGRLWRLRYRESDPTDVLIGSRNVGNGQVGYFISEEGHISGRGDGNPDAPNQCGPWANLTEWLSAELDQVS